MPGIWKPSKKILSPSSMPAAPTFMPIAFEALRERLRQEGFRLGVDHQLRLQELLERIGPHAAPGDLKTLLCPIFAANPAQQKAFYEVFDQVFQGFTEAAGAAKKIAAQPDAGSWEPPVQRT